MTTHPAVASFPTAAALSSSPCDIAPPSLPCSRCFSVATAETKDAAREVGSPGIRARARSRWTICFPSGNRIKALEAVIAAAKQAGIKEQAILEARFLYHVDRREDDAIAAMLPEFLKQQELFKHRGLGDLRREGGLARRHRIRAGHRVAQEGRQGRFQIPHHRGVLAESAPGFRLRAAHRSSAS